MNRAKPTDLMAENLFRILGKQGGEATRLDQSNAAEFFGFSVAALQSMVAPAHQVLSAGELAKAGRFRQSADRDRFVLGRAFVRYLCARRLKILASAVSFEESDTGRPHLTSGGLDFNVSHSGDCVLVAWSATGHVGADVERIKEREPVILTDMARSSFSTDEFAVFSAASKQDKSAIFHRVWVRKEALIKAEGVGLGGALKEFSAVRLESGCPVWPDEIVYPPSGRVWSLVDLGAPRGYVAALAMAQGTSVHGGSNVLLD
jgi:4'-phosphopantetheinyl transferase